MVYHIFIHVDTIYQELALVKERGLEHIVSGLLFGEIYRWIHVKKIDWLING